MAFLGQCCTRNCLSSKNSFLTFSISKPCKARQLRNIVTNQHSTSFRPTFHQLSPGAKKHSRIIFQNIKEYRWRLCGSDDGSCGIAPFSPQIPSAVDVIEKFYKAINSEETEKLDEKLDQILSDHCAYQDLFFYIPFEGKQAIKNFLHNVKDAMGPHIHMVVDSVKEGENYTATAFWHLGWKDKQIPFTTGCGFFECEEVQGKLLIRKITGVEEFPVKPGDLLLKLLKAISDTFERYPRLAEGMLQLNFHGTHEEGGPDQSLFDTFFGLKH
ncbi:uncharacterized protein LOC122295833 [Carya illinoinensis]|uniref:SnoaL-like domain-containing protein n=1 Tax=Carya illinoinensis TaxID=32201 RepID=A0A8T1N3N1_CARIL|nr:uncharacterized protein LOC122295833 [Carya illinoinensis]KAG6626056.1 hypothetical protein CIPAW_15G020400 [Carya illinoinensis]KAG6674011.1 hypothetical protein I3842_15G020900 [Carya illinoinensis]